MSKTQEDKFTIRTTKEQGVLIRTAYEFLRRNAIASGTKPPSVNKFITELLLEGITNDGFVDALAGGSIGE